MLVQAQEDRGVEWVFELLKTLWLEEKVPDDWRKSKLK